MTKNLRSVKAAKADGDGREVPCAKCGQPVRWTKTLSDRSAPLDPPLVYVRGAAHGEDALARLETVIVAATVGSIEKGATMRGVRCEARHPGAVAGRISHFATCPKADEVRAEVTAKRAQDKGTQEPSTQGGVAQVEDGALLLGAAARGDLAELLRDLLEEELERQGCVWIETERGVQITRETRPQPGSVGALRIGRLCAAVRTVEGLEVGTWRARRSMGGG